MIVRSFTEAGPGPEPNESGRETRHEQATRKQTPTSPARDIGFHRRAVGEGWDTTGHYCGIDTNRSYLRAGCWELHRAGLMAKRPELAVDDRFARSRRPRAAPAPVSPRRVRALLPGRLRADDVEVFFLPSWRPNPLLALLRRAGAGAAVRIAASHIKGPTAVRTLLELAGRGVGVSILTEETRRRVPDDIEKRLMDAAITIRRVVHPDGLPMHDKFVLIEQAGQRRVVFGSLNWTERSFRFNHEIGAICTNPDVVAAFAGRWEVLEAQAARTMR